MREYWKMRRTNKQPYIAEPTTIVDNSIPIQPTGWVSCLHASATNGASSHNANRFAPLQTEQPTPHDGNVQEEIRQLRDQVAELGRRLQATPGSSSARFRTGPERRAPSHRPQHERQTLAPRRRTPPPMHRGYMAPPPRRNTWVRRTDYAAPPRETQERRAATPSIRRLAPPPPSPRREASGSRRWEENVPSTTPRPVGPVVPPAPQGPSQARHVPTENQRKRERRRRNRHTLYRELEELVLTNTQVRVRANGDIYQEDGRIIFRISPTLESNERYKYLLKRLTPKPRKVRGGEAAGKGVAPTQERPPIILKRKGSREATPSIASSDSLGESTSTSASPMDGVEKAPSMQDGEVLPQAQVDDTVAMDEEASPTTEAPKKDVAMCVALTAHPEHMSEETWVPLPVTHDFTYPSDEEIPVNPKVGTSAPCFPISERRNALSDGDDILMSDISPK